MTELDRARQVAWHYVDYAARTTAEMRRRLERAHCDEADIETVIGELVRAGALDDERFARDWIESRGERGRLGAVRLEAELRRKGVARETARDAVARLDDEDQMRAALALAEAWIKRVSPEDPSVKRRLAGYLQRRGYNWAIIEQVFAQTLANTE